MLHTAQGNTHRHRHTQTTCGNLASLVLQSFPPFTFPLISSERLTNTHVGPHDDSHPPSMAPCLMTSVHYCLGRVPHMTTGMTQSVAVESFHRVKTNCVCVFVCVFVCLCALNKSNLLWFMGKLVCMHLWYASSPRVRSVSETESESAWDRMACDSWTQREHNSPGLSHKAFLSGTTSYCWQHRLSSFTGNTSCDTVTHPRGWIMTSPIQTRAETPLLSVAHRDNTGKPILIFLKSTNRWCKDWQVYTSFFPPMHIVLFLK